MTDEVETSITSQDPQPPSNVGSGVEAAFKLAGKHRNEAIKALLEVQREMKNPGLNKTNPGFRSKYADLNATMEAALPVFNKHGFLVRWFNQKAVDSNEVQVECVAVHVETGTEFSSGLLSMPMEKKMNQAVGTCITYGRRYTLYTLAGIFGEEDTDGALSADGVHGGEAPATGGDQQRDAGVSDGDEFTHTGVIEVKTTHGEGRNGAWTRYQASVDNGLSGGLRTGSTFSDTLGEQLHAAEGKTGTVTFRKKGKYLDIVDVEF